MIISIFQRASIRRLFIVLVVFLVTSVWNQAASAQLRLGFVGGANFATLSDIRANNSSVSFDNATAFHAGIFIDASLGPLNLRPAIYYLNAGALFEGTNVFEEDNFDVAYVTVPVDVIFPFGLGPLKPYFFLGPELRFFTPSGVPEEIENSLETFVLNGTTGLGLQINIPGSSVTLYPHLRYSFGISSYTSARYQIDGVAIRANESNVRMWLLSLGIAL